MSFLDLTEVSIGHADHQNTRPSAFDWPGEARLCPGDSDMAANNLISIHIYDLVEKRPGLLPILTLPMGLLTTILGDHVMEVTNPRGIIVWESPLGE
jgi:hypothetical protein